MDGPPVEDTVADESRIVEELRVLARDRQPRQGFDLVKLLRETRSPRVRNEAALALVALDQRTAEKVLVELLGRDDTKGARGTLLYALGEMNARVPLEILIEIVVGDGYEAREEALVLLGKSKFAADQRAIATARLEPFIHSQDPAAAAAAEEALELLRL